MRLSVACNFDPNLIEQIKNYPVYEVYGKLTSDYFGGGRPSFYLPTIDKKKLTDYVKLTHKAGIEFNYLINAVSMGNMEFTKEGQYELRRLLDWLSEIEVDSITSASLFILKTIKRRYPQFKVRISAHRFTDTPRKAKFWEDNGADCIVVSEVNIYREFEIMKGIRDSVKCDLQLIVNNSCRQDCAIACSHAVALNHASQSHKGAKKGMPFDYCSAFCYDFRLREPVNYLRANWIRPEDLKYYDEMGFDNYKIVERNTPTSLLVERVKAYSDQNYDGNLMDLVWNVAYPYNKFSSAEKDYYSISRFLKYFFKPKTVNMLKFMQIVSMGQHQGILFPRKGKPYVFVDNKKLNGFIDYFRKNSCQSVVCEKCRYCHDWAEKVVEIDPEWEKIARQQYENLFEDMYTGNFWEPYKDTIYKMAKKNIPKIFSFLNN